MNGEWIAVLTSVFAAVSVALGAKIVLQGNAVRTNQDRFIRWMALGTGVLLTAVLLDFLPDAWDNLESGAPWGVMLGVVLMWAVTQASDKWFYKSSTNMLTESSVNSATNSENLRQFTVASAYVLMISLSFHTFLEGIALAIAMQSIHASSIEFGIAMLIHKLPEGLLWGLAVVAAFPTALDSHRKRLWYALLVPALVVLLGTLAGIALIHVVSSVVLSALSAVMAGALLYICLSELLPTLREHGQLSYVHISFVAGILLMLIPIGIGVWVGA